MVARACDIAAADPVALSARWFARRQFADVTHVLVDPSCSGSGLVAQYDDGTLAARGLSRICAWHAGASSGLPHR